MGTLQLTAEGPSESNNNQSNITHHRTSFAAFVLDKVSVPTCVLLFGNYQHQMLSGWSNSWTTLLYQRFPTYYLSFFLLSLTGLLALSSNHSNSYLAYPGCATAGEIIVYDASSLVSPSDIMITTILLTYASVAAFQILL